jgi:hypothetical protein
MSRLRHLADKLLTRERGNEHGVNTPCERAHHGPASVNTAPASKMNDLAPAGGRVHRFTGHGQEQMNTPPQRERQNEHAVNNRCRHCGDLIVWRRGLGLAFADGTVAHVACDDTVEVARLLAAARHAVNPHLAADPAELMLQPGGLS